MKIARRYKDKKKNKIKILFVIILIIALTLIGVELYKRNKKDDNILIQEIANDNSKVEENIKTERMIKLEGLQKENSDIVAWIQIEGTNINYPVLQTTDNSYYMTHNYKKEKSKDGSLFLDKDYNWETPSTNFLIYGHNNIGSKEMFVRLLDYQDETFYKEHPKIRLTTNKEDVEYEIIAVFKSRVYYKSEKDVFRYYYFINAENEQEFNEYVQESKKASLYNIEATAEYRRSAFNAFNMFISYRRRKIRSRSQKSKITIPGTVLNRKCEIYCKRCRGEHCSPALRRKCY